MEKLFEDYLTNGLSEYDAKYLSTYKYVMLLSKNKNITANIDIPSTVSYPIRLDKIYVARYFAYISCY